MITGEAIGAIAMTAPGAGSDLAAIRTTAKRTDDGWLLNGSKIFITNGLLANVVIVCAKTNPEAGAKGVSLFLVDTSLAGYSVGQGIEKIGQHGWKLRIGLQEFPNLFKKIHDQIHRQHRGHPQRRDEGPHHWS